MLGYYNYTVILTYIGMLIGFTGISCAIDGRFRAAVVCLMVAGVCDMFDGLIASTKERNRCEKQFGIQIDSLSDLVCFGVLPALLLYCMRPGISLSLLIGSIYVLCALIRLAYFNVDESARQNESASARTIYQGMPVTLSALILPAALEFGYMLRLPKLKVCSVALLCMAVAFLLPFKVHKPNLIVKFCFIFCGAFELALLLAGVDI